MIVLKNTFNLRHRDDIDGLRAFAVIFVVVGHYFPKLLPQGFLGVDIFFVISGYVITNSLNNSKELSLFKFLIDFYAKRIRRLLPALIVVIISTLIISYLIMARVDLTIVNTGIYSLIGLANVYLWHTSSDYFGITAAQNPFTHTWSLAVEEQFYFVYPIIFWLLVRKLNAKYFPYFLIALTGLSFLLNVRYTPSSFAFYMMPTRFWEICLGASTFYFANKIMLYKQIKNIKFLAIITIAIVLSRNDANLILNQLIVCLATVILLFPDDSQISTHLKSKIFKWIGVRSYSIYLIHWPILVVGNYVFGFNLIINVFLLFVTIFLSNLNYKNIETKYRYGKTTISSFDTIIISLLIVFIAFCSIRIMANTVSINHSNFMSNLFGVQKVPDWPKLDCSIQNKFLSKQHQVEFCLGGSPASSKRYVFLIGDSHSDQLIPMVKNSIKSDNFEFKHANIENDVPFGYFRSNTSIMSLDYLENNTKRNDVIILTFHRGHLNKFRDKHVDLGSTIHINLRTENFIKKMTEFNKKMNSKGVQVILVKDTPLMGNIASSESCALSKKYFNSSTCTITRNQDEHTRFLQSFAFDRIASESNNVTIYDPFDYIYKENSTFEVINISNNYLMWDWNHISEFLSVQLASDFRNQKFFQDIFLN